MPVPTPPRFSSVSPVAAYVFAASIAVLMLQIRLMAMPILGARLAYIFFFPAVIASALLGGAGPGLLCTAVCSAGTAYFFLAPTYSFAIRDKSDLAGMAAFWIVSALVIAMAAAQRRARNRLVKMTEELIRTRDEALAASAAKSRFLAVMSHELRTPLNAVIGYAELIQEEMEPLGHQHLVRDLEKIQSSSHHLLTILNDLLDMSRIEAGQLEVFCEAVEAEQQIQDVLRLMAPLLEHKPVVLHSEICRAVVRADRVRLRQILLNLLFNAIKFTEEGSITVSCRQEAGEDGKNWIEFQVTDTGPGISPENQSRLFKSFSQLDSSSTRRHGGTGLGLAISKQLCEAMGGSMRVQSAPGQGSTFAFRLEAVEKTGGD